MKYPVAIHKDEDSCYGVSIPDIPGCFSAGETLDEAIDNTQEAISGHLEILAEEGTVAPKASIVEDYFQRDEYTGATWVYVEVVMSAVSTDFI
jgi:predicted RNase H-like HicB family nuclease